MAGIKRLSFHTEKKNTERKKSSDRRRDTDTG